MGYDRSRTNFEPRTQGDLCRSHNPLFRSGSTLIRGASTCVRRVPPMPARDPTTVQKQAAPIARALNVIAEATGRPFTMRDEPGRFRIQKAVYLLQRLGYPPAQRFDYNLYLMGPYSPDLTECYYALEDEGIRSAGTATDLSDPKRRVVVEALRHDDSFLEGLTTLLDVNRETRHLPAALAHARAIKPHINEPAWREVRGFLAANLKQLTAAT